ncbi:glycosyltransferase family protein [Hydrogenophaga soli]|nr:UDP-forming cellulose synthase catalytic subunit [Burkholderiaceae bacterium]
MNVRRIRYARLQMRLLARRKGFALAVKAVRRLAGWTGWQLSWVQWLVLAVSLPVVWLVISVPLTSGQQFALAVMSFGSALFLRTLPGRYVTQILMVLSLTASTRYLYWRVTETISYDTWLNGLFGSTLFFAELYAWIVLVFGYFQTAWPLERKPVPMPADTSSWPTVDVLIPTYNEPLKVVRSTVYAALAMDWPKDKLRVLILDDGRRDEFREFAAEAGAVYVIRSNNNHAKAGNINASLSQSSAEYVAIFDCDHIPTRTFLQVVMGWFGKDPKLAMVQTPHHFFSPDPFEKNLGTFKKVPNEGELFYGLLQDGNDLWNASFFCGSCAVLKRSCLDEVGGIATETVTEDAHTALKLHRRGYSTAFLAIPQAAGFATESLGGHVGQRIRWARGMAQIFRVDNPFLGRGLSLAQRLCYANAMLHFFYGLPRLIFLTAPLAYLVLGSQVISASALNIALFALPHLFHANLTNSRVQGEFRHSFWAEVYESVLAWYILRPVLVAVINPRFGKFNVTAKGGVNEKEYFDWDISRPYLILMGLSVFGFFMGVARLIFQTDPDVDTILLNLLWTIYNLMMLGASVAVANETRQVRHSHRVQMKLPAALRLANGRSFACMTSDYSDGGVGLAVSAPVDVALGESVKLALSRGLDEYEFEGKVTLNRGGRIGIQFEPMTSEQSMEFVQCTFARADSWVVWGDRRKPDKPMESFKQVLSMGLAGFKVLGTLSVGWWRERTSRLLSSPQKKSASGQGSTKSASTTPPVLASASEVSGDTRAA